MLPDVPSFCASKKTSHLDIPPHRYLVNHVGLTGQTASSGMVLLAGIFQIWEDLWIVVLLLSVLVSQVLARLLQGLLRLQLRRAILHGVWLRPGQKTSQD